MVSVSAPVYNPVIDVVDLAGGVFNVESEMFPGIMYQYCTRTSVCECPAGQHQRACKHGLAARAFEQGLRRIVAQQPQQPAPVTPAAPLPAYIPAPASFMECFAS